MTTTTVLRLEAAVKKNPDGVEDSLFGTTTPAVDSEGYRQGDPKVTMSTVRNLLSELASGTSSARMVLQLDSASSAETSDGYYATVTISHASISNGDTLTIGGRVLTWVVAAANENQITIATSAATDAVNLAAVINAHSDFQGLLYATASSGVVTIRTLGYSRMGRLVSIATSDGTAMVLSASRMLPNPFGAVSVDANPLFTISAATFSLPVWTKLVGSEINCFDVTQATQRNTVGPLRVVSVTALGVVQLTGDSSDLTAIQVTDVFTPIIENQSFAQLAPYGVAQ